MLDSGLKWGSRKSNKSGAEVEAEVAPVDVECGTASGPACDALLQSDDEIRDTADVADRCVAIDIGVDD